MNRNEAEHLRDELVHVLEESPLNVNGRFPLFPEIETEKIYDILTSTEHPHLPKNTTRECVSLQYIGELDQLEEVVHTLAPLMESGSSIKFLPMSPGGKKNGPYVVLDRITKSEIEADAFGRLIDNEADLSPPELPEEENLKRIIEAYMIDFLGVKFYQESLTLSSQVKNSRYFAAFIDGISSLQAAKEIIHDFVLEKSVFKEIHLFSLDDLRGPMEEKTGEWRVVFILNKSNFTFEM